MRKIICLLVSVSFLFVLGSCSLIGTGSTTTPGPVSSGYPDSVVYKIKLSNETYLCSSFNASTTDAGISLLLKDVYSLVSDGKITWIGQEKVIPAVTIEKISK
jgi:hypothetical protein